MHFKHYGDDEDRKKMTPGYSLYKCVETKEYYYRFTSNEFRKGRKKVGLVAQELKKGRSVQDKETARLIMEEAIRKGIVVIPGTAETIPDVEPLRDYVKRQLAPGSDVFKWRNGPERRPISPKTFEKIRAAFVNNAYDYLPPTLTVTRVTKRDIAELVGDMRGATKTVFVKDDDGEPEDKEVPKHSEDVIRSCLEGISIVCEYCRKETNVIEENPVRVGKYEDIKLHHPDPPVREILTRYEAEKLLDELKLRSESPMIGGYWERVYYAVRLGIYSGMREGEIRALKRSKIKPLLDDNGNPSGAYIITVDRSWDDMTKKSKETKGRYTRQVAIWNDLAEDLIELSKKNPHGNGFVFWMNDDPKQPIYKDRITSYTYAALSAIGIDNEARKKRHITVHSLRHFFVSATKASASDAALMRIIMKEVGHKSKSVHKIYEHDTFEGAYAAALISRDLLKSSVPLTTTEEAQEDD